MTIRGLVLEGGGTLGIAHLGSLEVLESEGILKEIKYYEGVSAGAIIATGLACGASIEFMREEMMRVDFSKFLDDSYGFVRDIARMLKSFGWYKGEVIEEWCGDLINKLTGNRNCTFKELYDKTGNFLELNAVNINIGKTVYFNHMTRPDLMLKKAIRYSLSIPFFYKCEYERINKNNPDEIIDNNEVIENDDDIMDVYYIDGGVLDNLPFHRLDKMLKKDEIIGQKFITTNDIKSPYINDKAPNDLIEFTKRLMDILRNQALKIHVKEDDWKRTIKIDVGDMSSTNFDLDNETKMTLLQKGKLAAYSFINNQ